MATMEFPDVHHKMSKKIAQLTKVIYHLNTKNDDNEYQLQQITDLYECEIEDILADAKRKIIAYKEQLEESRSQDKAKLAVQELQRTHENEKSDMVAEFSAFRKAAVENETRLKADTEDAVARLTAEVQTVKEQFVRRHREFEEGQRGLEQKGYDALGELRKIKDEEMENTVQEYNEKYKAMLAKQLGAQDELEASLRAQFKSDVEAAEAAAGARHEEVSAMLKAARQDRAAAEAAGKALRAESDANLARAVELEGEVETLKEGERRLNESLQGFLAQLGERETECGVLRRQAEAHTRLLEERAAALAAAQAEVAALAAAREGLTAEAGERDGVLERLRAEAASLAAELAAKVEAHEVRAAELTRLQQDTQGDLMAAREALSSLAGEHERARADAERLARDGGALSDELAAVRARAAADGAAAAECAAGLEAELAEERRALEKARQQAADSAAALSSDADTRLRTLQARHDTAEEEARKARQRAEEESARAHAEAVEEMAREHARISAAYKLKAADADAEAARQAEAARKGEERLQGMLLLYMLPFFIYLYFLYFLLFFFLIS